MNWNLVSKIGEPDYSADSEETRSLLAGMSYSEQAEYINERIAACDQEKRRINAVADMIVRQVDEVAVELMNQCCDRKSEWKALIWKIVPKSLVAIKGHALPEEYKNATVIKI